MVIALKNDNTTLIGCYENVVDFAFSNFNFEILETRQIKVTSKHFDSYVKKEVISTVSYSEDFSKEEMLEDYFRNYFSKDIKSYGINWYYAKD